MTLLRKTFSSFLGIYLVVISTPLVFAQKYLSIGDVIPRLEDVVARSDNSYKKVKLHGNQKLTILDFWGVNCAPCIAALPKLDSIQREFKEAIQIFLVSSATEKWLDSLYHVRGKETGPLKYISRFASITHDTVFHTLFHYKILPHYVWIDENGTVRAITGNTELTRDNIRQMIDDPHFKLPLKSELLSFTADQPLLPQVIESKINKLKFYSALFDQVPNYVGSQRRIVMDTITNTVRISRTGSMLYLFADAIFGFGRGSDPFRSPNFDYGKRVMLELKNSNRYDLKSITGDQPPRFHYELVLPNMSEEKLYLHYLSDLEKYFGLRGQVEKRRLSCYMLVRTSGKDKVKFEGDPWNIRTARSFIDDRNRYRVVAASMEMFRKALSTANREKVHVFVDSTGYDGLIDLTIENPLSNIPAVIKELREKYDLDIVEGTRDIEVMVLREQ